MSKKCLCGCGLPPAKGDRYCHGHKKNVLQKLCECGCGKYAKQCKRFIVGHSHFGKKKLRSPTFCACGCRGLAKPGRKYIYNHHLIGKPRSKETKIKMSQTIAAGGRLPKALKQCECGCGSLASLGARYIVGHNSYGRVRSEDELSRCSSTRMTIKSTLAWINEGHLYLRPFEYRIIIKNVVKRDSGKCIICKKKPTGRLVTHHIVPRSIGCWSDLCDHESNIVCMCQPCHKRLEPNGKNNKNKWKEFLPFAKKYLSKFRYKEMLLNKYLKEPI